MAKYGNNALVIGERIKQELKRQGKTWVSGFFRLVTPYVRNKVLPACT